MRSIALRRLGRVGYREALDLQERLVRERRSGRAPDTLMLLEHPHVVTLGSGASEAHVLAGPEERARLGIELFETGRGGDVTYHGPGQLVGYPVLDLKPDRTDLHRYLRDLEEVLILAAGHLGVAARRVEGLTGVWTDRGKLGAIGIRVSSGWITSHGFALNVHTDLSYFETIVPCGIAEGDVTSLEVELGRAVPMEEAIEAVSRAFCTVFDARIMSSGQQ
jgi:lipoyl(octanoyl) transferase